MPLVVTYFAEFIQEKKRRIAIALLFLFWPLGAAYVIMISWFILPSTGKSHNLTLITILINDFIYTHNITFYIYHFLLSM